MEVVNERIIPLLFTEIAARKGQLHVELDSFYRSFVQLPDVEPMLAGGGGGGGTEAAELIELAFTFRGGSKEISDVGFGVNFALYSIERIQFLLIEN